MKGVLWVWPTASMFKIAAAAAAAAFVVLAICHHFGHFRWLAVGDDGWVLVSSIPASHQTN